MTSPPTSTSPSPSTSVNVFRVPHTRMKELVDAHLSQVSKIVEFSSSDLASLDTLLQAVYEAMWELKSHEYIENHFIMDKLKERLQAKRVYNQLVCNCHEDSKLLGVIRLVEKVYGSRTEAEREEMGTKLQAAISDFLDEFLHHMEEEEKIFQPLLDENFENHELRNMNEQVLKQHTLFREKVKTEKSLKAAVKRKHPADPTPDPPSDNEEEFGFSLDDLRFRKSYCQEVKEHLKEKPKKSGGTSDKKRQKLENEEGSSNNNVVIEKTSHLDFFALPEEIVRMVLSYLGPRELLRVARLNRKLNRLAMDGKFWSRVYPSQWARGQWTFQLLHFEIPNLLSPTPSSSLEDLPGAFESPSQKPKGPGHFFTQPHSDTVVYSGVARYLLPRVGRSVEEMVVSGSVGVTSGQVRSMLKHCPNLKRLDLSYTKIGPRAFRGLAEEHFGMFKNLEELSLEGCANVDDSLLEHLKACFTQANVNKNRAAKNRQSHLKRLSLSGCHRVTSHGVAQMEPHQRHLAELDLSGIYQLDGETLKLFVKACPNLKPECLAYCSDIEDGPYPDKALGCQNLDCEQRFCCRQFIN